MKENLKYFALILVAVIVALVLYDVSGLRQRLAKQPKMSVSRGGAATTPGVAAAPAAAKAS